jgi:2-keto-4-pentenoate hydratase/2-oxohepta-3-ene-1,7-dioic acid hydratase in catechol pathway
MMKLVSFKLDKQARLGIKVEQGIVDVEETAKSHTVDVPTTMEQLIEWGEKGLVQLEALLEKDVIIIEEESIKYAPCVIAPEKILCVGLNYFDHSKECNMAIPEYPIIFSKFNNALAAHNQSIELPKLAEKFDYEAELVIVIGKEGSNISKENALDYVFGYTVGNDLSARYLQFRSGQWLLGKTCDGFAPIGPYLVTSDEIDPNNLNIKCEVNGEIRQSSNTKQMIFNCGEIISYASQYMTLRPGDIIFSGTPSGVILGYPENEQIWLKSGDKVTVSIDKIGALTNILK